MHCTENKINAVSERKRGNANQSSAVSETLRSCWPLKQAFAGKSACSHTQKLTLAASVFLCCDFFSFLNILQICRLLFRLLYRARTKEYCLCASLQTGWRMENVWRRRRLRRWRLRISPSTLLEHCICSLLSDTPALPKSNT